LVCLALSLGIFEGIRAIIGAASCQNVEGSLLGWPHAGILRVVLAALESPRDYRTPTPTFI